MLECFNYKLQPSFTQKLYFQISKQKVKKKIVTDFILELYQVRENISAVIILPSSNQYNKKL